MDVFLMTLVSYSRGLRRRERLVCGAKSRVAGFDHVRATSISASHEVEGFYPSCGRVPRFDFGCDADRDDEDVERVRATGHTSVSLTDL